MVEDSDQFQIKERRLLLFSTRIRFTPHTQPIRETAIDKILEQNLLLCDAPLPVREIECKCLDLNGRPVLPRNDIEAGLRRLVGKSVNVEGEHEALYSLSDSRKTELWAFQNTAEQRYRNIINRLFKGTAGGPSRYHTAFIESLSIIFSDLGEAYVRHLQNELNLPDLMVRANLDRVVAEIKKRDKLIDPQPLKAALIRFFEEIDPLFAELKWNLAQNHYVAKALGLDPTGKLLSKDIFGDGVFYIDTNVLVHSLDPTGRHHRSFESLIDSCKQLGIQIHVTQISIDELRRVAALEKELIKNRVPERIPGETLPRVRGILLPAYIEEIRTTGNCDVDKLFEKFDRPSEFLRSSYGIDVVDDEWFIKAESEPETLRLVELVKAAYRGPSGRKKSDRASLHDALMIRWMEKERLEATSNTWFVTLDMSLPTFRHESEGENKPYALTLVGLMHWLSPMAAEQNGSDEAAEIFSEALRQQLLPQENFFELRDFLIFSEMEMSTELLPAKDVEECIQAIKSRMPELNPVQAADREKLAHEISKFFVDPGRQYKAHLDEKENQVNELLNDFRGHKEAAHSEIESLRGQLSEKNRQLSTITQDAEQNQLRGEAKLRLTLIGIVLILSESLLFYVCNLFIEGHNFLQKFEKSLTLAGLLLAIGIMSTWFVVGKNRLKALGWPFTKILHTEPTSPDEEHD